MTCIVQSEMAGLLCTLHCIALERAICCVWDPKISRTHLTINLVLDAKDSHSS